jgi:L-aminopeptidase/D-esterase-like protein
MNTGPTDSLVDVAGLLVGHWTHAEAATGCTVILCPDGAVAGVDVRGGAPGTRETDLLRPECRVDRIHAVLLGGGSAFGLAAADGVMRWLEERGVGYDVGIARVPIVPAAILFDLAVARPDVRPGAEAGYLACAAACAAPFALGNAGAGVGCTVGKGLGLQRASRGGLGTASVQAANGLVVAALAVVNAFGNVHDPATGGVVAGVRRLDEGGRCAGFVDAVEILAEGVRPEFAASNTTLAVVATNGVLTKGEATKVAQMAHDGLARTLRPVHTGIDGDVVFALSHGSVATNCDVVGVLAADVLARAVLSGVRAATTGYGIPCMHDLN